LWNKCLRIVDKMLMKKFGMIFLCFYIVEANKNENK
jgi:hypothetical protein